MTSFINILLLLITIKPLFLRPLLSWIRAIRTGLRHAIHGSSAITLRCDWLVFARRRFSIKFMFLCRIFYGQVLYIYKPISCDLLLPVCHVSSSFSIYSFCSLQTHVYSSLFFGFDLFCCGNDFVKQTFGLHSKTIQKQNLFHCRFLPSKKMFVIRKWLFPCNI